MSKSFVAPGTGRKEALAPLSQSDVCRENIVARNADLERICPDAVDLVADATAALHDSINGRAADLAGDRAPRYFRDQLRGSRALTADDLGRLAVQAPADLCAWLSPILVAVAHGAPYELTAALQGVVPTIDGRLQNTREQLAEIEASIGPRVAAWKERT